MWAHVFMKQLFAEYCNSRKQPVLSIHLIYIHIYIYKISGKIKHRTYRPKANKKQKSTWLMTYMEGRVKEKFR